MAAPGQVWPEVSSDTSFGDRYEAVNGVLTDLVAATDIDRWILDFLFWRVTEPLEPVDDVPVAREPGETTPVSVDSLVTQQFGLERHLQDFLRDNWDTTALSRQDPEAGFEYPCDIGRIDILAHHRSEPRWLVVELKRNQTSDQTVGQVLRYIGWVRSRLAKPGEKVEGLIIAREIDAGFTYALSATTDVALNLYEVEFRLREPERK